MMYGLHGAINGVLALESCNHPPKLVLDGGRSCLCANACAINLIGNVRPLPTISCIKKPLEIPTWLHKCKAQACKSPSTCSITHMLHDEKHDPLGCRHNPI